ncbi:MAG: hypothetical protein IK064_01495 [Clostridia bacterium]|nr:hypothetical protein [Clostridia bacterium]
MNAKKLISAAAWLLIAAVAVCAALPACSKRTADGEGGTEAPVTEAPVTEASMTEALATDMPVTEVPTTEAPVNVGPVFTEIKVYRSPAEGYEMRLALSSEQEEEALRLVSGREWELTGIPPKSDYSIVLNRLDCIYCSSSGVLTDLASEGSINFNEEERIAFNSCLGIGAVRQTVFPEGLLSYSADIALLDTTGKNAFAEVEYHKVSDGALPLFCLIFRMDGEMAERLPWEPFPGERPYIYFGRSSFFTKRFDLGGCDLSRPGIYRMCFYPDYIRDIEGAEPSESYIEFIVEAGAPEPPGFIEDERTLRVKYPDCFDLDTGEGLDIFVYQMAPEDYSCALLPGSAEGRPAEELRRLIEYSDRSRISVETAKQIIACYGIAQEQVRIIPYRNIYSSYWYSIDAAYAQFLRVMFFGEE